MDTSPSCYTKMFVRTLHFVGLSLPYHSLSQRLTSVVLLSLTRISLELEMEAPPLLIVSDSAIICVVPSCTVSDAGDIYIFFTIIIYYLTIYDVLFIYSLVIWQFTHLWRKNEKRRISAVANSSLFILHLEEYLLSVHDVDALLHLPDALTGKIVD